ncbi:MAG: SOS response-associated peptidase [Acidimicrobiia bacterium]
MCGRFVSVSSPALVAERFQVDEVAVEAHEADYNVTPRSEIYVVREHPDHGRQLRLVRWGLVPSWAKDVKIGDRMINARAESLADKPAFRSALQKRRCIIPADGFYEWKRTAGRRKQPMFIHRRDGEPLAFAGLWAAWKNPADPDADWLRTCTIITTEANAAVEEIHDRMPLVLPESNWHRWLDPEVRDLEVVAGLLRPDAAEGAGVYDVYPVSDAVNRPANNGPELLARVEVPADE